MKRLDFEEGLRIFKEAPIEELQAMANAVRQEKHPGSFVSFVLDTNPNYTNVCNADCSFCAFYRKEGAKDAYKKSVAEVMQHLERARRAGLTTVLLQGGLADDLKLDYYVSLVKTAIEHYPDIHPHFFSAPEIWNCAKVSNCSVREVLQALYDAGQRTIPGGGAEILSERVRLKISPKKMETGAWMLVHRTAHEIGFRTTATMMYGHVEEPEDILIHLDVLRASQDEISGFSSFIPWSYKRDRTLLRRTVKNWAGKDAYFRILAFSRIYLDNFDHIAASWFGEGKEIGMQALSYGADDFGGINMEENVHRAANFINKTDHNGIIEMIRKAGFEPIQRNAFYKTIRTYENISEVDIPEEQRVKEEDYVPILSNHG
ncbi:MAG: cyclic dehypoxanthinyl futalosine synthase [Chlamydiales bacterium]|nr:cyclic dehypoxanthinyl futalosine synthase [Chlamydiales bacterium]